MCIKMSSAQVGGLSEWRKILSEILYIEDVKKPQPKLIDKLLQVLKYQNPNSTRWP